MTNPRLTKLLPWITTPLILLTFLTTWDLFARINNLSELVLPRPLTVLATLTNLATDPQTWYHAHITTTETLTGFTIALATGITTGTILGKIPWIERSLRPIIIASQVIPKIALIPLFVIWFGFGMTSKIIMAAMLAFFPIMLNVQLGVRSVQPGQHDVMKTLNATRWQTFTHLELKSTLPHIFTGMEVGIVFAIIGTIVGEYLGGNEGLGYLIVRTLNELNAPALFAVITLLSTLGLTLYLLINTLKRLTIPWHESIYQHDHNT